MKRVAVDGQPGTATNTAPGFDLRLSWQIGGRFVRETGDDRERRVSRQTSGMSRVRVVTRAIVSASVRWPTGSKINMKRVERPDALG